MSENVVETAMENLPTNGRVKIDFPDPLSDGVRTEALRRGMNVHKVASDLGVKSAPMEALPPAVRTVRSRVDKAVSNLAAEEAKLGEEVRAWDSYKSLLVDADFRRNEIQNDKGRLMQAKADVAGFSADFAKRHFIERQSGWKGVCDRISSTLIAERMVADYPAAIEKAQAELANLESQIAELRKRYDFV